MKISYQRLIVPSLLVLLGLASTSFAQEVGHIQVKCPPNIKIFLDGKPQGTTSSEKNGLIIQNVAVGNHIIKAIKDGCQPQEKSITISNGQVFLYTVESFSPSVEIHEEGATETSSIESKTGELIIQSLPIECTIDIPALDINGIVKSQDRWHANKIKEGTYDIKLISGTSQISKRIEVKNEIVTKVMANFVNNSIEVNFETPEGKVVENINDIPSVTYNDIFGCLGQSVGNLNSLLGTCDSIDFRVGKRTICYQAWQAWYYTRFGITAFISQERSVCALNFEGEEGQRLLGKLPYGLHFGMSSTEAMNVLNNDPTIYLAENKKSEYQFDDRSLKQFYLSYYSRDRYVIGCPKMSMFLITREGFTFPHQLSGLTTAGYSVKPCLFEASDGKEFVPIH